MKVLGQRHRDLRKSNCHDRDLGMPFDERMNLQMAHVKILMEMTLFLVVTGMAVREQYTRCLIGVSILQDYRNEMTRWIDSPPSWRLRMHIVLAWYG